MRTNWEPWRRMILAAVALLAIVAAGTAQETAPAKSKATFERVCSNCHTLDSATSSRRTKDQWQEIIDTMITDQGAKISDEEYNPILDYLVAAYGKVNVNKAPAEEIAAVLGVPAKDAEAIVKFRKANGNFDDFEALAKVPGVDRQKLEKNREAITF